MSTTARAFWITAPSVGEIREETLRAPAPGEVVVRTLYSGISRGTEAMVFAGRVPASEWTRMRAPFQDGAFPAPVKYGYAAVGVIEDGHSSLRGRTVFVLYPHQTRFVVPERAAHLVPDDVPANRAVLAANMETATNGIWDAQIQPGDRVAVIGGGTVGSLVAWLAAQIPGCEVELIDINPVRAVVAAALGIRFAAPAVAARDVDVVIHASGSPSGLALALELAAFESRIVELSWFGDADVALKLGGAFHSRRLTIASSQVGQVAASQRPRWDTTRRMALALRLLSDPTLDALISGDSPFEELPSVLTRLSTSPGDTLCHRIRYVQP